MFRTFTELGLNPHPLGSRCEVVGKKMFDKPVIDTKAVALEKRYNARLSADRFEAVDALVDRCESISLTVANKTNPIPTIAA